MRFKNIATDFASPYIHLASYAAAMTGSVRDLLGANDRILVIEFRNAEFQFCVDEKNWIAQGKRTQRALARPTFLRRVQKEQQRTAQRLRRSARSLKNLDHDSNAALVAKYKTLFRLWREMNRWGHLSNTVDFGHTLLTQKCTAILRERLAAVRSSHSLADVFSVLTTPREKSLLLKQDRDLYRLLAYIESHKNLQKLFRKPLHEILEHVHEFPTFQRLIRTHVAHYDWMQFQYDGPTILDAAYFLDILRSELKQRVSGKQKLAELKRKDSAVQQNQRRIIRELGFSKDDQHWLTVARTFVFLKALRKETVFEVSRHSDGLIREIARRLFLSPKQVRHMTIEEVEQALRAGKVQSERINDRIIHSVLLARRGNVQLLSGKEANAYSKNIIEEKVDHTIQEFKGDPSYAGIAKGVVRLVARAEDMQKMHKGDILVSPATNPNILPAMKKAAAIVTDEGGVTCHAAIVSRELKIPCVIGTKIATKVLKDGDRVEVDAERGIVKKLH